MKPDQDTRKRMGAKYPFTQEVLLSAHTISTTCAAKADPELRLPDKVEAFLRRSPFVESLLLLATGSPFPSSYLTWLLVAIEVYACSALRVVWLYGLPSTFNRLFRIRLSTPP
jgi:hypothetical protein